MSTELRAFFDEETVQDFKLTFSDEEWAKFQATRANPLPHDQKIYVHCGVEALGQKFADAAYRSKGRPKTWVIETKPQFVVRFNHWDPNGQFLGLHKVNFETDPYAIADQRSTGHVGDAPAPDLCRRAKKSLVGRRVRRGVRESQGARRGAHRLPKAGASALGHAWSAEDCFRHLQAGGSHVWQSSIRTPMAAS